VEKYYTPPVHNSIYVGDLDPKAMARSREFTVALGRQDIKITYLFHRWAQSGSTVASDGLKWQCFRKCAKTGILYTTHVTFVLRNMQCTKVLCSELLPVFGIYVLVLGEFAC